MDDISRQQQSRLQRLLTLGVLFCAFFGLVTGYRAVGLASISDFQFYGVLAAGLVGYSLLLGATWFEWNLLLKDPDLTFLQLLLMLSVVIVTGSFVEEMRSVLILLGVAMMLPASVRLAAKAHLLLVIICVLAFGISLWFPATAADPLSPAEISLWLVFTLLIGLGPVLLKLEWRNISDRLVDENTMLKASLAELHPLVVRDPLTGAQNAAGLVEILARHKAMADRRHYSFSVAILDLDQFRSVNEMFGHVVGDMVLKEVVRQADVMLREVDAVARIEGAKFALVLSGADTSAAAMVARRLAVFLHDVEISNDRPRIQVTSSFGIVQYQMQESVTDLLDRCDHALYEAKRRGGNQIINQPISNEFEAAFAG